MAVSVRLTPLRLTVVGTVVGLSVSGIAAGESGDSPKWDRVIENQTLTSTLVIEQSNVLVRNNTIRDVAGSCIYVRKNVHNVRIEGNKISRCHGGDGKGIFVTTAYDTRDISIVKNTIRDTDQDGIHAGNHSFNLRVANNDVSRTGKNPLFHGMYIKSQGAVIENNTVHDVAARGGNGGIALRSSGVVRGNTIWNTGGYGIRYVNTQPKGAGDKVTFENNVVYSNASETDEALIGVLVDSTYDNDPVDEAVVRFNTVVALSGDRYPLQSALPSSKSVKFYGNALVNKTSKKYMTGTFDLDKGNLTTRSTKGFVRPSGAHPFDFHLKSSSSAVDAASGVPGVPPADKDGRKRTGKFPDAGAHTFVR